MIAEAKTRLAAGERVALLSFGLHSIELESLTVHAMPQDADDYARQLYATLRTFDSQGFNVLLLQTPPTTELWLAVHDRLQRAAKTKL